VKTLDEAIVAINTYHDDILNLRAMATIKCPAAMEALKLIDSEYTTLKKPKGYNLTAVRFKKEKLVFRSF